MSYDGPERRRNDAGHFRGQTEAQIESIQSALVEIKGAIEKLAKDVDGLRQWKAMVYGIAAAVAAGISLVMEWIKSHLK